MYRPNDSSYLFEWTNRILSTESGDSAVRRADTVQPAALKARSLAALVAGTANS